MVIAPDRGVGMVLTRYTRRPSGMGVIGLGLVTLTIALAGCATTPKASLGASEAARRGTCRDAESGGRSQSEVPVLA